MRGFSRFTQLSAEQLPQLCSETGHSCQHLGGEYDVLDSHASHSANTSTHDRRTASENVGQSNETYLQLRSDVIL